MSPGMSFFEKIHFDVVQRSGICVRLGPCATWAVVGTRLWFWDPLSLLVTFISHMECHAFAGPPMHIPAGCSCRTAGLSVLGYQLKKVQKIQRYLGSSHNSVLSYDLWRKGHWAWCSGSCWLNYSVLSPEKRQSWHIQKQLQLIDKILTWRSYIKPLHICGILLANCSK